MKQQHKKTLYLLMGSFIVASFIGIITYTILKNKKILDIKNTPYDKSQLAVYIQGDDGNYTVSDSKTFPTEEYELNIEKSSCSNGGTLSQNSETKRINATISNTDSCVLYFDREKHKFSLDEIIASSKGTVSNFDSAVTTAADSGVFEMADDYGTSYYYRGVVENNYVKFAGFYWRIIRVNGDGSLRIIYDGTQAWPNGNGATTFTTSGTDRFTHTGQVYNANYDDAKYVGWMYGPAGTTASTSKAQAQTNTTSSDMKTLVDSWYKTNIVDKGYSNAVSDTLFCNDRSTPGQSSTGLSGDTGLGYENNVTAYGAAARSHIWNSVAAQAQFTCPNKNDAFTVSDTTNGNGALTYPVGLITADEIVAAGSGKYATANYSYYLYKTSNYFYWSLSPRNWYNHAAVFIVGNKGQLSAADVNDASSGAVAPVINLSAEYVKSMVGTGIMTDPYRAEDVTV